MDGFLANIKRRRERDPSICINCGVNPRDEGYQYCSRDCAREAQAKLLGKVPVASQPPPPAPMPPAANDDSDDSESDEATVSDPTKCEECHKRPKHFDSAKGILYQFCGRRCRDAAAVRAAQPHCKLKGCKKTFSSNDEYCSSEHGKEAVRRGEAPGCPVCDINPISPGFKHCSRECAIKQSHQPKPGRSDSSSNNVPTLAPQPAPPMGRGPLPDPPVAGGVDKDSGAPSSSSPGLCEHCGAKPKSVKVHRHCSKECARAAHSSQKTPGAFVDSDEDDWVDEAPSATKPPQYRSYDDDDDGWGSTYPPPPLPPPQAQVDLLITKTYSCCDCRISVKSGSPPAECPICKLEEVKKELEAEKAKPPTIIRVPQAPPAPAPAPAPAPVRAPTPPVAMPVPSQPPPPPPQIKPVQANPPPPPPQIKPIQLNPFPPPPQIKPPVKAPFPSPPQQQPAARASKIVAPNGNAGKPGPPPKAPVQQFRRQLDEEEEDSTDDDLLIRRPEPTPAVTVESEDEDDDNFFVR